MADLAKAAGSNANQKAVAGFVKLLAVIIILLVSIFGDIVYIVEIQGHFSGFLLIAVYGGGITGFLTVCYLLFGKLASFRPGGQMLASWLGFGLEICIVTMNIMYLFSTDHSGVMGAWGYLSPATPIFHLIVVSIVTFLDPALKVKHRAMELVQEKEIMELEWQFELERAALDAKRKHLKIAATRVIEAAGSDASYAELDEFGKGLNNSLLEEMTGRPVGKIPAPKNEGRYGNR